MIEKMGMQNNWREAAAVISTYKVTTRYRMAVDAALLGSMLGGHPYFPLHLLSLGVVSTSLLADRARYVGLDELLDILPTICSI